MATLRADRMLQSAPSYYEDSVIYENMQQAQADEYDAQEEKDLDLQSQLTVLTATWGLRYWEEAVGLPVKDADSYVARRGRVIARLIGPGNFSAKHLFALAAGYGEVIRVDINPATFTITVTFQHGIPLFYDEYVSLVEAIVHAHLGVEYKFEWQITITIGLKTNYVRYVYSLPFCGTFNCGQWPAPIDQAYTATYIVGITPSDVKVEQVMEFCGTLPTPEIQAYSATYDIGVDPSDVKVDHEYQFANTINTSEEGKL